VGWRSGWGASVAACLLLGAGARGEAVELRAVHVAGTPHGATARLVLSAPARLVVHPIPAGEAKASRLYLDLPQGTRLARGIARLASAAPPVAALRVGMGEGGVLRVVLDLEEPISYEVRANGRIITVALATATVEAPPAPAPSPSRPVTGSLRPKIVLDPGHGGTDPGAEGFAVEKEVTLDIARRLATLLEARLGADVVLTRARDTTLPLAARTARANAEGADLFLSIHANAARSHRLHGVETYYLNNTNDRATIRLAAMENGLGMLAPRRDRADLRYILSDLVQVGKMEESVALATAVQRGLVRHLSTRYPGVSDLGVKRGPFYVLVGAYMPCVLVETSFVSHPAEGRRLAAPAYRAAVAEGIYAGVERFVADTRRARTL
jgi:N-acetylmuramoyl-L-alanine amidase